MALAILLLICFFRRPDPRKMLTGQWTSNVSFEGSRVRTALRLNSDGNAEIRTHAKSRDSASTICANTQWQLLSDGTLQLQGDQTITCRILNLNGWSMITTSTTDSGFAVRWIEVPKVNAKAILLIAMAVLLPILVASSLPHSGPSHAIANGPQYAPSNTSGHGH